MKFAGNTVTPEWLAIVREKVESLRFGVVQIVVHDGKVTQIERTERTRLDSPTGATSRPVAVESDHFRPPAPAGG